MPNVQPTPATPPGQQPVDKQALARDKVAELQHNVYFNVLASRGYEADTAEKVAELLETGRLVETGMKRLRQSKQAQETSFVKQANAALAERLGLGSAPAVGGATRTKLAGEINELAAALHQNGWGDVVAAMEGGNVNG